MQRLLKSARWEPGGIGERFKIGDHEQQRSEEQHADGSPERHGLAADARIFFPGQRFEQGDETGKCSSHALEDQRHENHDRD